MRVALLGATGRTGRAVVDELLRRGHDVVALVRDPAAAALPPGAATVAGDARDGSAVATLAQDKAIEQQVWAASGLDWTLVRPPRLVDRRGTGEVEHSASHSPRTTWIRRVDLARFIVDCAEQDLYVGAAPLVAGR